MSWDRIKGHDAIVAGFRRVWSMWLASPPLVGRIFVFTSRGPVARWLFYEQGIADRSATPAHEVDAHLALLTMGDGGRAFRLPLHHELAHLLNDGRGIRRASRIGQPEPRTVLELDQRIIVLDLHALGTGCALVHDRDRLDIVEGDFDGLARNEEDGPLEPRLAARPIERGGSGLERPDPHVDDQAVRRVFENLEHGIRPEGQP